MTNPTSHFWDSCVIARYLTGNPKDHVADIAALLKEAVAGKRRIYISTLLYAEVRPSQLKAKGFGSMEDLLAVTAGAFLPIGPTVPIMMQAARLRDHMYFPQKMGPGEKKRVLTVPDSVHLATCLHLKNDQGLKDIDFVTLDDGKGKNYEEKAVSLLRYHDYCTHVSDDKDVQEVCALGRVLPLHSQPLFA